MPFFLQVSKTTVMSNFRVWRILFCIFIMPHMYLPLPTSLSNKEIIEFQNIYKTHFDIDLNVNDASVMGVQFLNFIRNIILLNQDLSDD